MGQTQLESALPWDGSGEETQQEAGQGDENHLGGDNEEGIDSSRDRMMSVLKSFIVVFFQWC